MKQYLKPAIRMSVMATTEQPLAASGEGKYFDYSETLPDVDAGNQYVGYAKKSYNAWEEWDDEDSSDL